MQHQAIWPADKVMTVGDAFVVSLSGIATVFITLIVLAFLIVLVGKILNALGVGESSGSKKNVNQPKASKQIPRILRDDGEVAAIAASVSEFSRVPIERLKIKSITQLEGVAQTRVKSETLQDDEVASIVAAVSEFSRVPVERLKIKSITEVK